MSDLVERLRLIGGVMASALSKSTPMQVWKIDPVSLEEAATSLEAKDKELAALRDRVKWKFCPECGSEKIHHEESSHKQCGNCFQEWFSDVDYSDVVQVHLGKNYCDSREAIQKAEARAETAERRVAELEEKNTAFINLLDSQAQKFKDCQRERDEAREAMKPFAKVAITHPVSLSRMGITKSERDAARAVIKQGE